jgi:cation transport ATPase
VTQAQQAEAAVRQDFSQQRRRHAIALMMVILGVVIGVYHLFEHLEMVPAMTGTSSLDDLVVGWPMALGLAVVAAMVYGR